MREALPPESAPGYKALLKPLLAHFSVIDHRHSVVDRPQQRVWIGRNDGESMEHVAEFDIPPRVPEPSEREGFFFLEVNQYRDLPIVFPAPLVEAICGIRQRRCETDYGRMVSPGEFLRGR